MKKISILVMALIMLVSLTALADGEPMVGMPNPMSEYAGMEGILEEYPAIEMAEPPAGAQDVLYFVIDSGDGYPVAEIRYTIDGTEYTYRCLPREKDVTVFGADAGYLAGLYYDFDVNETAEVAAGASEVAMDLHYCTAEGIGCAVWYDAEEACEYSVSAKAPLETIRAAATELAKSNTQYSNVSGRVTEITDNGLTLLVENGNVITIPSGIDTDAAVGDEVTVVYTGALTDNPYVISITVDSKAAVFSGTVTAHDKESVTVQAASGTTLVFKLSGDTLIAGADKEIKNHAQVTVTYTGSIEAGANALEVQIDVAGDEIDPALVDKELKGTVIKLTKKYVQIKTDKNKKYKFNLTSETQYTGKTKLAVNATVVVTYDGYASKTPDAKIIKVTAAPKPTPTPAPQPKLKKVTGTVTAVCGIWITLDDGNVYTVNGANCTIKNQKYCKVGYEATLQYYKENGERICKKATFSEPRVY